jgi:hypothetical protein
MIDLEHIRGYQNLPFSLAKLNKAKSQLVVFEGKLKLLQEINSFWKKGNIRYRSVTKKLRLYISHFIQVYNMAMTRGEFNADGRQFYNLPQSDNNVPKLLTDKQLMEWGKNLIEGERNRVFKGGPPMVNPTIGNLKVHYDIFMDMYFEQQTKLDHFKRIKTQVIEEQNNVDNLIRQMWNEIEDFYRKLPVNKKIEECKNCGIIYYLRNNGNKKDKVLYEIPFK